MNKFISLVMIATMFAVTTPFVTGLQAQTIEPETGADTLTNEVVSRMLTEGLSAEIVIAKIRTSKGRFDTSPGSMQALKEAGVPDGVILAMVESHAIPQTDRTMEADSTEVSVPDGLEFEVELSRTISGQDMKLGDIVDFSVMQPVVVDGVTIIEKGASARAHITTAKKNGRWGRAGKLEWAMKDVYMIDGTRTSTRFTERSIGSSSGGTVAVAAIATTVLLGPLGLLWGLKKGKPAVIAAGNRYSVFIHGDTTVRGMALPVTDGQTP